MTRVIKYDNLYDVRGYHICTAPVVAENGAVMVKVVSKKTPSVEEVEDAIKQDVENSYRFGVMTAFNDYVTTLEASTPVKSNLDLFYRD